MTAANTYGRQIVATPTNKSGGGVILGDVVILDGANNEAFTTTTSASSTGIVGIAMETIANNAVGRVLLGGYASLVNVNASVTRGHFGITHTVAKQATDGGASRTTGTFCFFMTGGTTPTAWVYNPDLGGASLTNPMTTSQDIIVGGASGTPGRLAIGAAGGVLGSLNSVLAYLSGTSNPGAAATGDIYYRSDLGYLIKYDGTRWLTLQEFTSGMTATLPGMTTGNTMIYAPINSTYDLYVTIVDISTFVATTNDGTNNWTCTANKTNAANSNTSLGTSSTSADSANTWVKHPITVNAVVTTSGFQSLNVGSTKNSSPGALYFAAQFRYRLVIT